MMKNIIGHTIFQLSLFLFSSLLVSCTITGTETVRTTKTLISRTMMKNIMGHAIFQLIFVFVLVFAREKIFDIDSGRYAKIHAPPSAHFTIVFNVFVMMTLFNEINARKIHGQRNVFKGLFTNPIFVGIWIVTFISQIFIIEFGGRAFSTSGLTIDQWLWCIFLGLAVLIWGQLVTTLPSKKLPKNITVGKEPVQEDLINAEGDDTGDGEHTKRSGQILWIRGLTRLQTQLRVVRAFRKALEDKDNSSLLNAARNVSTFPSFLQSRLDASTSSIPVRLNAETGAVEYTRSKSGPAAGHARCPHGVPRYLLTPEHVEATDCSLLLRTPSKRETDKRLSTISSPTIGGELPPPPYNKDDALGHEH